ncbi:MAG: PIN domain-containing protein [Verrucomicrobiota bacterium]|nr:PIN domain-containing protein [Verrucomicrobiota bacterium]
MREYFDTPALVFLCGTGPFADAARQLVAASENPITTPHALAECFNSLTHRLGFPPRDVRKAMQTNLARFEFVVLDDSDYLAALDRVVDNGLTGDKIYDALHAMAADKGQAEKIFTSNRRDFTKLTSRPVERIG